jgi:flotillin
MDIQEMNADRAKFSHKVNECVGTELAKYGLELINVNFKDITDEAGVIKAMGEQAAAEAINSAKVDVATQNKLGDIGVARESLERDSQVARLNKERDVRVSAEMAEKEELLQEQV